MLRFEIGTCQFLYGFDITCLNPFVLHFGQNMSWLTARLIIETFDLRANLPAIYHSLNRCRR